jgi:hypothetical protein
MHTSYKRKHHLTRHSLDVVHPMGQRLSQQECRSITNLPGIDTLICDLERGHMEITYDLDEIHLQDIEQYLVTLGYIRKRDLFHQIRNNLAHFFEKNESRA